MPESKSVILVVGDDTVTRDAVATVLEEQGYNGGRCLLLPKPLFNESPFGPEYR